MTDDREWNHAVVVAEKSGRPAKPPHPSGSHLTHRWREMDSNLWFRTKSAPLSETAVPSPMTV
jgi:hypothetical protein